MKGETRKVGFDVKAPENKCDDKKCPFHGEHGLKLRGRTFTGTVVSDKMHRSVIVEWYRQVYIPKFERYLRKRTKVTAHNSPCINAKEGEKVEIVECRPLSKSKNFVIIHNLGKVRGYEERKAALEESKVKEKKKEEEEMKEAEKKQDSKKESLEQTEETSMEEAE